MTTKARSDVYVNLPALQKLDSMLIVSYQYCQNSICCSRNEEWGDILAFYPSKFLKTSILTAIGLFREILCRMY